MIIIPNTPSASHSTCPKCGKDEEIIEVCAHCGHKYDDERCGILHTIMTILLILSAVALAFFIMAGLVEWIGLNDDNQSLFDIYKNQFDFLSKLRVW